MHSICSHCNKNNSGKKRAMHGPLPLFDCSAAIDGYNCLSITPARPQMQRGNKMDAQKALNSCLISSFSVSIIKSGFNWVSNNLFIQLEVAFSNSSVLKSREKASAGTVMASWMQDSCCTVGQFIDSYSVAIHSMSIYTPIWIYSDKLPCSSKQQDKGESG